MTQKELYEQQIWKEAGAGASADFLGQREGALLQWVCSNTGNLPGASEIRVAELSVGDGQLSRALARTFLTARIDCVDISPSRLEYCRQLAAAASPSMAERMRFMKLNLDTEFGRLERTAYDMVIAIDVLEHVFDPFGFVKHCSEILKTGGRLFLRVPNIVYFKRRLAVLGGHLPITSSWFETPGSFQSWKDRHGWDGGHLHFFSKNALEWLLTGEGFRSLFWRDVGAKWETVRRIWPTMLFGNLAVFARKLSTVSNASAR